MPPAVWAEDGKSCSVGADRNSRRQRATLQCVPACVFPAAALAGCSAPGGGPGGKAASQRGGLLPHFLDILVPKLLRASTLSTGCWGHLAAGIWPETQQTHCTHGSLTLQPSASYQPPLQLEPVSQRRKAPDPFSNTPGTPKPMPASPLTLSAGSPATAMLSSLACLIPPHCD